MVLRIANFAGEIPKLLPRLLPDNHAQIAQNTKLENGALVPIRRGRHEFSFTGAKRTIFRHHSDWFGWEGRVDVAPAPVADGRLYVTGGEVPKVINSTEEFPLALKKPESGLTAFHTGTPDSELSSVVLYTYTYITKMDEESEPAPLSKDLVWSPGIAVTLSGFSKPPADRGIDRIRIYRSQTSALGETGLYFIAERPASHVHDFVDVVEDNPIQELLASLDYNPPPDDLAGITALPNGMMAAFIGKRLYFSEPYKPHAWPEKYVLTTDYTIVGLGVFGTSVAILTEGNPYVAVGTAPENMAMERLRVNLPCVSAAGIVDMGSAVCYPSPDGLVSLSLDGAQLITRPLISREQWLSLTPASFVAGHFEGRYVTSYVTFDGVTELRGMLIVDMTGEQPFIVRASDNIDAAFNEIGTGTLFVLKNGKNIYEWDAPGELHVSQLWRSKKYVQFGHNNYGAILIEGEYEGTGVPKGPLINISDAILVTDGVSINISDAVLITDQVGIDISDAVFVTDEATISVSSGMLVDAADAPSTGLFTAELTSLPVESAQVSLALQVSLAPLAAPAASAATEGRSPAAAEKIEANQSRIDAGKTGGAHAGHAVALVPVAGSLIEYVPDEQTPSFSATVYADGKPIHTVYEMNKVLRLPSGFLALQWEVEIRGNARVHTINLAASPSELMST